MGKLGNETFWTLFRKNGMKPSIFVLIFISVGLIKPEYYGYDDNVYYYTMGFFVFVQLIIIIGSIKHWKKDLPDEWKKDK